jgi:hypothetical protein
LIGKNEGFTHVPRPKDEILIVMAKWILRHQNPDVPVSSLFDNPSLERNLGGKWFIVWILLIKVIRIPHT